MRAFLCLFFTALFYGPAAFSQININVPKTDNQTYWQLKTQKEIDAIKLPAAGYTVLNTTTGCINYFINGRWYELCGDCLPRPQATLIDSFVQVNQSLKIFLHQNVSDSIETLIKDINLSYRGKGPVLNVPLPLKTDLTELHLQIHSFNSCGKEPLSEKNNFTVKIKPVSFSKIYELFIDNVKYLVRDIGDYTWMVNDYKFNAAASNIPGDIQKRQFYSLKIDENVCPAGWDIPATKQWEDYLHLLDNMTQAFVNPKPDNISLGLRTEGLYSVEEKKLYAENATACYWAKDSKDGKRFAVNITTNSFMMVSEKPELLAAKIRCIKPK